MFVFAIGPFVSRGCQAEYGWLRRHVMDQSFVLMERDSRKIYQLRDLVSDSVFRPPIFDVWSRTVSERSILQEQEHEPPPQAKLRAFAKGTVCLVSSDRQRQTWPTGCFTYPSHHGLLENAGMVWTTWRIENKRQSMETDDHSFVLTNEQVRGTDRRRDEIYRQ